MPISNMPYSGRELLQDKTLFGEYCENYLGKLFYFYLRKTSDSYEAEELVQEVSLAVVAELQKGTFPKYYSAWIWRIARNKYSLWAKRRQKHKESFSGDDLDETELADDTEFETAIIKREELSLLRRELAFISSDYRKIVAAYYFDDRSVADIAQSLHLTEGTVKIRLFRARKILKEGINMAREFGAKSYRPEQVSFTNSCSSFGDYGQPWTILTHSLYKNIFLEVYENPETAEEISLALGIALPYMEDELKFLTSQTFLIEEDGRYKTTFPIISAEAQRLMYEKDTGITGEITMLLERLVDVFSKACFNNGDEYYGGYQSYEDAKWTLLMRTFDYLSKENYDGIGRKAPRKYTIRPDNGRWDIVGYQDAKLPELSFVGLHGVMTENPDKPSVHFQQFKFDYKNIQAKTPGFLSQDESIALKAAAEGKYELCEKSCLDNLLNYGYIRKDGDKYIPKILVFDGYNTDKYYEKFTDEQKSEINGLTKKIKAIFADEIDYCTKVALKDIPKYVGAGKMFDTYSAMQRGYVLERALSDGWLQYGENTSSVIGAYLYI